MTQPSLSTSVCLDTVPAFVGPMLEQLYENVFSVLPGHAPADAPPHVYVERRDGQVETLLLFRRAGNAIRVLNEGIVLDAARIERFAAHVFDAFPMANMIRFNAIRAELDNCSLPFQKSDCSEDIVVGLPDTVEAYFSSLGNATRKNIKRYRNRLARCFPEVRHEVIGGTEVSERQVADVLALNRERMARKGKTADDAGALDELMPLLRRYGFVSLLTIDGRVAAGEICTRVGRNYFDHVGAHDPAYDDYALGMLSCYLTICECIRRGGAEFHFLWGRYPYKYSLGGVQRDLQRLSLYRSRAHLVLNGHAALQFALGDRVRRIKVAANDPAAGPAARLAIGMLARLRERGRKAGVHFASR